MAKKSRKVTASGPRLAARPDLASTQRIEDLLRRKRWTEARDLLEALGRLTPNQPALLANLVNVYYELHDLRGYEWAAGQLLKITPNDADLTVALAGAQLGNAHLAQSLRTFRRFLERWPDHPKAAEARLTLAELEPRATEILTEMGLSGENGIELAALHEQVQSLFERGESTHAQKLAERILRQKPDFVPVLNNLSQIYLMAGQLDRAIATAQQVLEIEPENVHALGNLARFLFFRGKSAEARSIAQRLKAMTFERIDARVKIAEALSFLGDDAGVVEVFASGQRPHEHDLPASDAILHHLAAVATLRLGRTDEARRLWKEALRLSPGLSIAAENVADLSRPAAEREGPWPFPFNNWISTEVVGSLADQVRRLGTVPTDAALSRALREFLRQHPEVVDLVPALLDRGDPNGREFAMRLARLVERPELLRALRDFALGQRGPDTQRIEAANLAMRAGLIPPGLVRMWLRGGWTEVLLLDFEISPKVVSRHSPNVQVLVERGTEAMRKRESTKAESLFKEALQLEPDALDLLNNLAAAYTYQKRWAEAEDLIRTVHAKDADYLFGRTAMAEVYLRNGDVDAAKAMLNPLLTRHGFHTSEFAALCSAEIDLALAQKQREAARSWLGFWSQVDPDSPLVAQYRRRIG